MNKELEFLKEHCVFNTQHEVYVLLAVSRKKDTPHITNSQEIVFREIIKSQDDIGRKFRRLRLMCENYRDDDDKSYPFYVYITNNSRCSRKSGKALLNLIADCMYEETQGVDMSSTFKKLDYKFVSALMKKAAKGSTRRFMIDVDTKDMGFNTRVIDHFIPGIFPRMLETFVRIETRNGFHYKTPPFDIRNFLIQFTPEELKDLVSVKPDGLLFVEYMKNED